MARREWTRNEQLLALRLYCLLPFGKLHKGNGDIIAVAKAISRTPSAVAMKACNFASLDPALERKGLGNASQSDRELWEEFIGNSEKISSDAEETYQQAVKTDTENYPQLIPAIPKGETESIRTVRMRRVQSFFRKSLLVSYRGCCALTGLNVPELLISSHIIPWSKNKARRADPTNGILLNVLYDKLFDKGLITFDDDFKVIVSECLHYDSKVNKKFQSVFEIEGLQLNLPDRFHPDISAINYRRQNIFQKI